MSTYRQFPVEVSAAVGDHVRVGGDHHLVAPPRLRPTRQLRGVHAVREGRVSPAPLVDGEGDQRATDTRVATAAAAAAATAAAAGAAVAAPFCAPPPIAETHGDEAVVDGGQRRAGLNRPVDGRLVLREPPGAVKAGVPLPHLCVSREEMGG